ncbi:MAG TPA: TonB-dependent receptor [Steroidobacteraceae bacterium]|nr:TonB-dependent receptor [Steroidobacteraceae bacterium]
MKTLLLATACAAANAVVWSPAQAQTPAQSGNTATNATVLEEIVVTAERRRTSLQVTPIAATVMTGEKLADSGVMVVDQLQFISPGATVNNFGQGIDFNIRGIGKAEHNTQTTTGVITYRDGVATFPGYFTAEPYYDIARVEILRGPQGTFVGQNATGGAVFVTSQDPVINGGTTGYVQGQVANYNGYGAQGALNLPVSDTFAARVAFNGEARDSFYDIAGPHTGDDGVKTGSARLGLLWAPSENLSVLLKTDYNYLDLSGYPSDPVNARNDLFDITANGDMHALDRFGRAVLKLDYTFGNGTTLRSVSGYQEGRTEYRADLDGTSIGNSLFGDKVDETIYSQEINLISADTGRFTWVFGAYYQDDEYEFLPGEFYIVSPAGRYELEGTNPKEAGAVFGQLTFGLTDSLELQLGARYTETNTTNHIEINQFGLPLVQEQKAEYSNTSGKVALNWTVDPHQFLYAFVATGFRPGGLNVPVGLGIPAPFDEELVTNYEVGWKAGWMDGNVRTQLSAFYNDYENFQVIVGYPTIPVFGFELNVPNSTTIYGFEAQLEAAFGQFSIDAGLGWLHSELGKFFAVDPRIPSLGGCNPQTGPATASCIALEGNEQTYAPNFTFNLGMQYDFALASGDRVTPRVNYGHVAEQWATLFENEARGDRVEARNIVNAQIAWRHESWVTTLYGANLTDQHYVGAINSGLRFAGPPRTFGVRLLKAF